MYYLMIFYANVKMKLNTWLPKHSSDYLHSCSLPDCVNGRLQNSKQQDRIYGKVGNC